MHSKSSPTGLPYSFHQQTTRGDLGFWLISPLCRHKLTQRSWGSLHGPLEWLSEELNKSSSPKQQLDRNVRNSNFKTLKIEKHITNWEALIKKIYWTSVRVVGICGTLPRTPGSQLLGAVLLRELQHGCQKRLAIWSRAWETPCARRLIETTMIPLASSKRRLRSNYLLVQIKIQGPGSQRWSW